MKDFVIKLAQDAGKLALDYMGKAKISVKGERDIVTEADKAVEALIIKRINEAYPTHNIISEESGDMKAKSDFTWFIDPIDGTHNYAHSDIHFAISIGVAKKGVMQYGCIFLPAIKEMYYAEKGKGAELNGKEIHVSKIKEMSNALASVGIRPTKSDIEGTLSMFREFNLAAERVRDYGFAAGELAFVASGKEDLLVRIKQNVWDIAAGSLIVEESGGKITDFEGKELVFDKITGYNTVASNGLIHNDALDILKTQKR